MAGSFNTNLAQKMAKSFTWNDYRTGSDDTRWELIDGEAMAMSPSPGVRHQAIAGALYRHLANFFHNQKCSLFIAPLDVKLSDRNVVQPDLEERKIFEIRESPAKYADRKKN